MITIILFLLADTAILSGLFLTMKGRGKVGAVILTAGFAMFLTIEYFRLLV